jgi:hypothetical protein
LARRPEVAAQPARTLVNRLRLATLRRWRHGEDRWDWTVRDFVMALGRLGGHQNRKGGGLPGWLTLWRGWQALQTMMEGIRLARR